MRFVEKVLDHEERNFKYQRKNSKMSEKTPVVLDKMVEQQAMAQNTDFDYKLFKSDSIRVVTDKIVFKKIEVKIRLESAFVYQITETTPV